MYFYKIPGEIQVKVDDLQEFPLPTGTFYSDLKGGFVWQSSKLYDWYYTNGYLGAFVQVKGQQYKWKGGIFNGTLDFDGLRKQNQWGGGVGDFVCNKSGGEEGSCFEYLTYQITGSGDDKKVIVYRTGQTGWYSVKIPESFNELGIYQLNGSLSQSRKQALGEDTTPEKERIVILGADYRGESSGGKFYKLERKSNHYQKTNSFIAFGYRTCKVTYDENTIKKFGLKNIEGYCTSSNGGQTGTLQVRYSGHKFGYFIKEYFICGGISWTTSSTIDMKDVIENIKKDITYNFSYVRKDAEGKEQKFTMKLTIEQDFVQGYQFVDCYIGDVAVW